MNNNWFRRLLLSYLPVFFIVTTILFFIFFQVFNEQNRREALKANEFLASQVTQYLDNSLRSIDFKVLREILTNPNLKNYFSVSGSDDVYAGIQAVQVLDELKIEYPLIDSIYLVRYGMARSSVTGRLFRLKSSRMQTLLQIAGQGMNRSGQGHEHSELFLHKRLSR